MIITLQFKFIFVFYANALPTKWPQYFYIIWLIIFFPQIEPFKSSVENSSIFLYRNILYIAEKLHIIMFVCFFQSVQQILLLNTWQTYTVLLCIFVFICSVLLVFFITYLKMTYWKNVPVIVVIYLFMFIFVSIYTFSKKKIKKRSV